MMKKTIAALLLYIFFVNKPAYATVLQDALETACTVRGYNYTRNFNIRSVYATLINSPGIALSNRRVYFSNGNDSYYQLPGGSSLPGTNQKGQYASLISTVYSSLVSGGTVDLCYDYRTSPFTVVAIRYDLR